MGLQYYPLGVSWQQQPWARSWVVPGPFPPEAIPPTRYILAERPVSPPLLLGDDDGGAPGLPGGFLLGAVVGWGLSWLLSQRR